MAERKQKDSLSTQELDSVLSFSNALPLRGQQQLTAYFHLHAFADTIPQSEEPSLPCTTSKLSCVLQEMIHFFPVSFLAMFYTNHSVLSKKTFQYLLCVRSFSSMTAFPTKL